MIKRSFDIIASFFGILIASPILLIVIFLVWRQDKKIPFYVAPRSGKNEKTFMMVKLRSMTIGADKSGVDSTSENDLRITPIGKFIRKYKMDEITQLWNVFIGDMSIVGPRPNVKTETDLYTSVEKILLSVRPGITDFSSIIFADEGEILNGRSNPNLAYNQLIRPWKSRLGLLYIENQSFLLDIKLIFCTLVNIFSRKLSLTWLVHHLDLIGASEELIAVSKRNKILKPCSPPGSNKIVSSR